MVVIQGYKYTSTENWRIQEYFHTTNPAKQCCFLMILYIHNKTAEWILCQGYKDTWIMARGTVITGQVLNYDTTKNGQTDMKMAPKIKESAIENH